MLLVKTKIAPSKIAGIGIFADKFIPQGTPVWELTPGFDQRFKKQDLEKFPKHVSDQIMNYCYIEKSTGDIILAGDDARFFNHSEAPNCGETDTSTIALRDIQKGEELTEDYRISDAPDYYRKLGIKT